MRRVSENVYSKYTSRMWGDFPRTQRPIYVKTHTYSVLGDIHSLRCPSASTVISNSIAPPPAAATRFWCGTSACLPGILQCVSTNAIVTVEYSGPIAKSATIYDSDTREQIPGIVSDDQRSVTIDMSAATPRYSSYYYWNLRLDINNCDASYTRGDNFVQLSYVDDEENIIDLSGFETPSFIDGPDTGVCGECGSRKKGASQFWRSAYNRYFSAAQLFSAARVFCTR